MLNFIRSANLVVTFNSYSCIIYGVKCFSLLKGKFPNYGRVIWSSSASQKYKLRYITNKKNPHVWRNPLHTIPKSSLRKTSDFLIKYSFTINENTAEKIAAAVMDSVSRKSKEPVIIEINPGLGLITKQLFARGLKNLIVYDMYCWQPFKIILQKYKENIVLHDQNAFNTTFATRNCGYLKFFDHISNIQDNEIIIIGVFPNRIFFRRLLDFITVQSFSSFNNVEFFVVLSDRILNCLLSFSDHYSRAHDCGFFSVLFDTEVLQIFPRSHFLPLSPDINTTSSLVKLKRKTDNTLQKEDILLYRNFLDMIGSKKNNYVIGELERWFPGSGPYFIAQGMSVTIKTFECSPEDFLKVFRILQNIKGYEDHISLLKSYTRSDFIPPEPENV